MHDYVRCGYSNNIDRHQMGKNINGHHYVAIFIDVLAANWKASYSLTFNYAQSLCIIISEVGSTIENYLLTICITTKWR